MTSIEVSAQFGGFDAGEAILPHFHALKRALDGRSFPGFPIPLLDFVLRVDGQLKTFGQCGVGNLKFDKKRQSVSVDIVITTNEWKGRKTSDVASYVAGAVMASVEFMKEQGGRRLEEVDWHVLEASLREFAAAYVMEAGRISDER
jgi:hypothetical protein